MIQNVLGTELERCGLDPVTGFFRDGSEHQTRIGNNLSTPMPDYGFPGLVPGDRWCVTAGNWLRAHRDGAAAPVVLASTHHRVLDLVPLDTLKLHAVDVPPDPASLDTTSP
jgi:uncharacterized protein (DUF2237 family)